jgi:hypothetical protein
MSSFPPDFFFTAGFGLLSSGGPAHHPGNQGLEIVRMTPFLFGFCFAVLAAGPMPNPGPHAVVGVDDFTYSIDLVPLFEDFDGEKCWFHPRAGVIPHESGGPAVVLTMQRWFVGVSDYFSGLSVARSEDLGGSWAGPVVAGGLAMRPEDEATTVGVCDFTPGWHPQSRKLLGFGHTVRYQEGKLMKDPRPRETAWSVYDAETGNWSPWRTVKMPDAPEFFNSGNGCGQWLVDDNGDLMVPFYFKPKDTSVYASSVMRCRFDGQNVIYLEHGEPLRIATPRGVYEPSLTRFQDHYYLTLRNDDRAYVSRGADGLNFEPLRPWTFDDGEEIGSYNTQAHWVTHSDALFLVYTRRGANNDHIMRHRAPLFMSQVDTERMCLLRATEQIVVPERGAMLGNFGVVTVSPNESWITDAEGMYKPEEARKHGATGAVWASKIRWSKPNLVRLP